MRFSVVIPTCHRLEALKAALERLAPGRQELTSSEYEVIVSDDDSEQTAVRGLAQRHAWVRWVRGPGKGPAANRNAGASKARGEWLAFMDDDCLPDAGWLQSFAQVRATHPEARVLEGRTYADRPRRSLAEVSPINETGGNLWSCNFAVCAEFFRELGGFDERFRHAAMEDVDLSRRIGQAGTKALFVREASVCHPWRMRTGSKTFKDRQEATLQYLRIHPDERTRFPARFFWKYAGLTALDAARYAVPYRGAGLGLAMREVMAYLKLAWLVSR